MTSRPQFKGRIATCVRVFADLLAMNIQVPSMYKCWSSDLSYCGYKLESCCRRSPEYRRRDCAAGELPGTHTHTNSRERLEEHRDSRFGAARLAAFLNCIAENIADYNRPLGRETRHDPLTKPAIPNSRIAARKTRSRANVRTSEPHAHS